MRLDLVSIGDINWDTILMIPHLPGPDQEVELAEIGETPGGDAANMAVAFARLGGKVGMVGAVGDDTVGQVLLRHLIGAGVETLRALSLPGISGRAFSLVEPGGIRRLLYSRGANARRILEEEDLRYIFMTEWLYISDPLPSTVEQLGEWYRTKSDLPKLALDPGSAGASRGISFFAPLTPYLSALFLNEGEAITLTGSANLIEAVDFLQERCPLVVVKRGASGALVATRQQKFTAPALPVKAVDTTGCGDAFNAAFLFSLVRGRSLREAALWGNAAGALVARKRGAYAPTSKEIQTFLAEFKKKGGNSYGFTPLGIE